MKGSALAGLAFALLLQALPARASHLDGYVFTFDTPPDSYTWSQNQPGSYTWSPTPTFTTSLFPGDPKLGPFTTATVLLGGMDYLRAFGTAYLGFDVYFSGSWSGTPGDDRFTVKSDDGQTILDATFSNVIGNSQSYPTPGSSPRTGSFFSSPNVSAYHIVGTFLVLPSPTIPGGNCCTDVGVFFQGPGPGSWYLDNVVVSSTPIPEPQVALLLCSGLLALGVGRTPARERA
jgi:hypothetical protein